MDIQRKGANRYKLRRTVYAGVGAIALVLLLLVGKGLASRPPALDTDVIWTGTVTRGEFVREVTAAGALVSRELRTVTNTNDGVVERILALPGQTVQPESVLIEMSSPTLEEELASARWNLDQAEAEAALRAVELENQQLDLFVQVAVAEAEHTAERLELEAMEALDERQVFSELDVERARLRVQQLHRRLEAEQARLERFPERRLAEEAASNARISRQRAEVGRLESRVDALNVTAKVHGVVQEINVQEGERLTAGHAAARVVNTNNLIARVRVSERDATHVMAGMPVRLEVGRRIEQGKVIRIDPTVRERAVHVDVSIEDTSVEGLRPDLSVTARIELERVADALIVDRPAGLRSGSETFSMFRIVGDGDRAERTNVEIGRVSNRQVEVLNGLSEGDQVILADLSQWREEAVLRIH